MSNVTIFRNYLRKIDLNAEEFKLDDGSTFFRFRQSVKNGGTLLLIIAFSLDERLVDFKIYDLAKISDPLKREPLHRLLNELNADYRFTKFIEIDGDVSASYSMFLKPNEADPEEILDMMVSIFRTVEESYSKFMKIQWA